MSIIPQNGKWIQANRSTILGSLWSTFGLDFLSNLGVIRLAKRLRLTTSTSDDSGFGCPVAMKSLSSKRYAICGSKIFTATGVPSTVFTVDALTGVQTNYSADYSDLEIFNDKLISTTLTGVYSCDGSAWTSRDSLSITASVHVIKYFKKYDRVYYSDTGGIIRSMDTSWVTADPNSPYAIQLSSGGNNPQISCMDVSPEYFWIGAVTNGDVLDNQAVVFQWDGISSQVMNEFRIPNARGVMSIKVDPATGIPHIIDSNGILRAFNGVGFPEIDRLPQKFGKNFFSYGENTSNRFMHPNGMVFTDDGTLLVAVNNTPNISSDITTENLPSGVWEWNKGYGFTHKHPITYNPASSTTVTDAGQNKISRIGMIATSTYPRMTDIDGTIFVGATYYTDDSTEQSGMFIDNTTDTIQKSGYFVTSWLTSGAIREQWSSIWAIYKKLLNSADRIIAKYRIVEEEPIEATITWVDTTSFTTLTDVSAYANGATGFGADYGGEVEILNGTGGGFCRHITNISESGGTYTITLDDAVTGVTTGTAVARFQKWIKITPEIDNQVEEYSNELSIDQTSPRIQFKVYMEFTGQNEFYKIILKNQSDPLP